MKNENIHIIREEKCSTGTISLRSDKILMYQPFEHINTVNVDELNEMYAIFMDITGGVPHLYYTDNTNTKSFGAEERILVSNTFHHFASACGIKENSAITRFITHSIVYLNKPKIPLKMFKTEEAAINWLKSLN
ncbi:MAG: hypothetical protein J5I47_00245 [Vicingus serpentipes]|nr:hypothetical protein [Vicingus serpentipes]